MPVSAAVEHRRWLKAKEKLSKAKAKQSKAEQSSSTKESKLTLKDINLALTQKQFYYNADSGWWVRNPYYDCENPGMIREG